MTGAPEVSDRAGLTMLSLAAFTSMVAMRACDPLLPAFAENYSASMGQVAQTISLFAVAYGLMQLVYGPLGDRFGKFRVIGCAVLGCMAGNALAAVSGSLDVLLLARVMAGATAAGIIPLSLAWVGDSVGYEHRQAVLARLMLATLMGTAFGQWMSGVIADTLGWRWVFAFLALMFLAVGTRLLLMDRRQRALARVTQSSSSRFLRNLRLVLSVPWARTVLLAVAVEGAFAFSALAFIAAYLHERFGLSLNGAAFVAALFAAGGLFYAIRARWLVDRLGEKRLVLVGAALLGFSFVLMALTPHWSLAVPASMLAGLGFSMLHGTLQAHATQMVPDARGTAVSLFGASLFLGQSAGVFLASIAIDRLGFQIIFIVASLVIAILGVRFAAALTRRVLIAS